MQFGNNRGNKYSKKSTFASPTDPKFWTFSLDDFAFHDIPESINYILNTTGQPNLAYIGFSQGTTQAFAALSIQPALNDKVSLFIALAPAMAPPALSSGFVDSLMRASPNFMFLAFGRRAILASTTMWQALLYPPIFVRVIDMSLKFLFGWAAMNITAEQKMAAYSHLYSYTSVKSVVHWFQIIRRGRFQMYDDEPTAPWHSLAGSTTRYYQVAKFPTRNIRTPILLVYGGMDGLIDISVMKRELPQRGGNLVVREVPHYEHLDFLWASDVQRRVFPVVFEALERGISGMVSSGSVEDLSLDSLGRAEFSDGGGTTAVGTARGTEDEREHEQEDFFSDSNNVGSSSVGVTTSADDDKGKGSMLARGARRFSNWLITSANSATETAATLSSQAASRIPMPSISLPTSNSGTPKSGTTPKKEKSEAQVLDSATDSPMSNKVSKPGLTSISPKGITVPPGKAVGGLSLSDSGETITNNQSGNKGVGASESGNVSGGENSVGAVASGNESSGGSSGLKKEVNISVDGKSNKAKKKKGRKGSVAN
jgi:pimeloyl-ACP methyl ester carboxylesterase